jgi:hypothetical protein
VNQGIDEATVRDFIADHMESFTELIPTYEDTVVRAEAERDKLLSMHPSKVQDKPRHLLRLLYQSRMHRGLSQLKELTLVGKEYPLLQTGTAGRQPSADILAVNPQGGLLALIELKTRHQAAREAVTELSQYGWGLFSTFLGAGPADVVWMPIMTEWRKGTTAAMWYQMMCGNQTVLPFRAHLTVDAGALSGVTLELVDLAPAITETEAAAMFAIGTLDGLCVSLTEEPTSPNAVMDFIVAAASRLGYSGFVLYTQSAPHLMYPHTFVIGAFNPYKCLLKARELEAVAEFCDTMQMRSEVRAPVGGFVDYDLGSRSVVWPDEACGQSTGHTGARALGARELSEGGADRMLPLLVSLEERLVTMKPTEYEVSTPQLPKLLWPLEPDYLGEVRLASFFGLLQEVASDRLLWEHRHHGTSDDESGLIGPDGDPFGHYRSVDFWDRLIQELNYFDWGRTDEPDQDC